MRKISLIILFIATSIKCYCQTVTGWDAVVTSGHGTNNYQLIGTYQGWDPNAIYIAGYTFYNNPNIATKRIYIGSIFQDFGNGDVGIGTNDPKGYKLAVNGNIRAKEIKVEAGPWPDYVFKPTYKLPSLTSVKAYIDKNQHLPDMPSEQEVTKDGVNLGELNKLLVKKVEELTLYLIEKEKQLESQDLRMKKIEKQLQEIINSKH